MTKVFEVEVERQTVIRVEVDDSYDTEAVEEMVAWELENKEPNGDLEYITDDIQIVKTTEVE